MLTKEAWNTGKLRFKSRDLFIQARDIVLMTPLGRLSSRGSPLVIAEHASHLQLRHQSTDAQLLPRRVWFHTYPLRWSLFRVSAHCLMRRLVTTQDYVARR